MKLTNAMRDSIIDQAMVKAFGEREKKHAKNVTALADSAYTHEYGALEKIANKLPDGWCETSNTVKIEAAGFSWRNSNLAPDSLRMSKSRRVPRYQSSSPVKIGGAHTLNEQAQAVAEEHKEIETDRDALRAKLRAVVYAATTVEKLLEAWPECKTFLPEAKAPVSMALVPVELVPQLNAAIGLKPFATRRKAA